MPAMHAVSAAATQLGPVQSSEPVVATDEGTQDEAAGSLAAEEFEELIAAVSLLLFLALLLQPTPVSSGRNASTQLGATAGTGIAGRGGSFVQLNSVDVLLLAGVNDSAQLTQRGGE